LAAVFLPPSKSVGKVVTILSFCHHSLLVVIPSEPRDLQFHSLAAEAEEENCRSLGFARDDNKERVAERGRTVC
jgi:hypothetical protein